MTNVGIQLPLNTPRQLLLSDIGKKVKEFNIHIYEQGSNPKIMVIDIEHRFGFLWLKYQFRDIQKCRGRNCFG